ncbi:uncharacterized protein LOC105775394 [Gossypium raimondii]|uniref:uncharacterized protein LOC105775394 n=1 Tax=Gossypium raimondii TaxID=29730 RepID=UPI00227AAB59|nr:uncharacterized protein LOC105775394 [Gossypium raimondii]
MSDRFTHIINGFKALGKIYLNKEMVKKMLNSLPKSWEPKVTVIKESKDLNLLSLDELMGSLLTYEMKINHNAQEIKEAPKKVGFSFKSKTRKKDEGSSNDEEEAEMVKFDCPQLKKKRALKQKKKVMMATWSDINSSNSDEDNEVANLCLMAIDKPKEEEHCFKVSKSKKNSWYLDSGCSRHMTGEESYFMELMPKNGGKATFGDNSKGLIEDIGSIDINSSILIKSVLYVNGLKHNLLSISQLCDKGFKVIFESNGCKVVDISDIRDAMGKASSDRHLTLFAFAVYGLIVFPKAFGYVSVELADFLFQIGKGVNPAPAVLAETIISINFIRRK